MKIAKSDNCRVGAPPAHAPVRGARAPRALANAPRVRGLFPTMEIRELAAREESSLRRGASTSVRGARAPRRACATRLRRVALQLLSLAAATSFAAIPVTCWDAAAEFNDSENPDAAIHPASGATAGKRL